MICLVFPLTVTCSYPSPTFSTTDFHHRAAHGAVEIGYLEFGPRRTEPFLRLQRAEQNPEKVVFPSLRADNADLVPRMMTSKNPGSKECPHRQSEPFAQDQPADLSASFSRIAALTVC